jgi:hypothetical protein
MAVIAERQVIAYVALGSAFFIVGKFTFPVWFIHLPTFTAQ